MRSERHQRDQIESKVANLKPAKGSRPAELPKAGIDAETVAAAVGDIEKELTELERHLRRLDTWEEANLENSTARRRLWERAAKLTTSLSR